MSIAGPYKGDPTRIPPQDLEALAALLTTLVPAQIVGTPGFYDGWQACCSAIRTVATVTAEQADQGTDTPTTTETT